MAKEVSDGVIIDYFKS